MNTVMYIMVNKALGMSIGKACAQASHAAVKARQLSKWHLVRYWDEGSFVKIILGGKNEKELEKFVSIAKELGLKTFAVHDEGRTELKPGSLTAIGLEIVDKDEYWREFREFSLMS